MGNGYKLGKQNTFADNVGSLPDNKLNKTLIKLLFLIPMINKMCVYEQK